MAAELLIEAVLSGILLGCFYAAVSLGLSVAFGLLDVPHIAHPAFLILGAYGVYLLSLNGADPLLAGALLIPFFFAMGIGFYRVYYAVFEKRGSDTGLRGLAFLFGVAFIVEVALILVFGVDQRMVDAPYIGTSLALGEFRFPMRMLVAFEDQRFESHPGIDPLAVLPWLAGITERVALGTSVVILPYRSPVPVAKLLASVDVLSGGRLIVGAAIGWLEGEFAALGVPFKERVSRSEEALELLRVLWTEARPDLETRRHRIAGVQVSPMPLQKPRPAIWIGGGSEGALRRVARLGDGWHATAATPSVSAVVPSAPASTRDPEPTVDASDGPASSAWAWARLPCAAIDLASPTRRSNRRSAATRADSTSLAVLTAAPGGCLRAGARGCRSRRAPWGEPTR